MPEVIIIGRSKFRQGFKTILADIGYTTSLTFYRTQVVDSPAYAWPSVS